MKIMNSGQILPHTPHLFEGQIWEYETKIIDFIIQMGEMAGRTLATSTVRALFYVHETLTQKQTRELAKRYLEPRDLRGYSMGSISNIINDLQLGPQPFLAQNLIPGTNEYKYQVTTSIKGLLFQSVPLLKVLMLALDEFARMIGSRLEKPNLRGMKGYQQMVHFLNSFQEIVPAYREIIEAIEESIGMLVGKTPVDKKIVQGIVARVLNSDNGSVPEPPEALRFDPEIHELERLAHRFFLIRDSLGGNRPKISTLVMVYFYTRADLTQEDLEKLTGLSRGKISEEVRKLVRTKLIKKYKVPGDRARHYRLISIPRALIDFLLAMQSVFFEGERQLLAIRDALVSNKESLALLTGYNRIREVTTDLLKFSEIFANLRRRMVQVANNLGSKPRAT